MVGRHNSLANTLVHMLVSKKGHMQLVVVVEVQSNKKVHMLVHRKQHMELHKQM